MDKSSLVTRLSLPLCVTLFLLVQLSAEAQFTVTDGPVVVEENLKQIVANNGIFTITVDRRTSNLTALTYNSAGGVIEVGKLGQSMYFDSNGSASNMSEELRAKSPKAGYSPLSSYCRSVEVTSASPESCDIVATGGPTPYLPFTTEIHYIIKRGVSGFYAYCVYKHGPGMPAGSVGQSRFVLRGPPGPGLFTDVAVDDQRIGPVDESPDVRAVSDATFLQQDGNVYCKYNNSAFMADHHVHGMMGHGVGVWMINASEEYVNGGPTKQELTVHQDNTLLNMLQGGHYGGGAVDVSDGENWTKVYGPFLVYLNSGKDDLTMFADAKRQTLVEESDWPYQWLKSPDYSLVRGAVAGQLHLSDGKSSSGAWVVLAKPGGDWPMQSKNYEYWRQADKNGRFLVSKVLPGVYALYAYGANQFMQLEKDGVTVLPNQSSNLGVVNWQVVKHGQLIWQIGTPDRSTLKYRGGQDNWGPDGMRHWANFMSYPAAFPGDVTYTIGKSHEATDWNFAQWTWYSKKPYWSVDFVLSSIPKGVATLTFGIAAADPLHGRTHEVIYVNGQSVGELNLAKTGAAAYRSSGEDSLYQVVYLTFPATILKAGSNEMRLGDTAATKFPTPDIQMLGHVGALMFDSIRLEVDPNKSPTLNEGVDSASVLSSAKPN